MVRLTTFQIVEWGPAGVCAAIGTWNAGLAYFAGYVGSALASGNTLIYKASEKAPFSPLLIADLISKAGFPPGVLNIISGGGETGALLSSNMQIRVLGFTGSAPTGKKIAELAARTNLKKVILELGGKAPGIVFDDCNMENALQTCADIFLSLNGQACTASTRILVQSTIVEDFTKKMKERFERMEAAIGCDPIEPTSGVGTLADTKQLEHVLKGLEMGKESGTVLTGGGRKGTTGCYVQPTIFVDVKEESDLWREEIYGPVVLIKSFETEEEAIRMGNDTEYGLAAQIFTRDIARALRVSRKMDVGFVTINAGGIGDNQSSFGGVKGSGLGRIGGWYGVKEFMESKTIKINMKYDN
jgi:aldehyde dehydrogenase (NAD+)